MKIPLLVHHRRLWLEAASVATLLDEAGHPGAAAHIRDLVVQRESAENERHLAYQLDVARKQADYERAHPYVCGLPSRWRREVVCARRFATERGLVQHQQRAKRFHYPAEVPA